MKKLYSFFGIIIIIIGLVSTFLIIIKFSITDVVNNDVSGLIVNILSIVVTLVLGVATIRHDMKVDELDIKEKIPFMVIEFENKESLCKKNRT